MKSTRQPIAGIESPKAIDANDNTIEIDDTFFRMMSVYVRLHCSIKTTNIRKIQFRIVLKMSDCLEWSECEREREKEMRAYAIQRQFTLFTWASFQQYS